MKKVVFHIPTILFAVLFGLMTIILGVNSISSIVIIWITLFLVSGLLLSKDKFWGAIFGMLPGIHWIYMSTQETGQAIDIELPLGITVLIFYILSGIFIFYKKNQTKN